jgi:DNA-directed RNA polymerase specialized sigma24 family protein
MWGVSHNDALGDPAAGFHTTRWTMVLACGEADTSEGQQALADLFRTYWYPLYAYVRRSGYSEADAEDLVQGFCVYLQEKHAIAKADPLRGRFRSFLLTSLKNFLSHERDRAQAEKRGGKQRFVFLDAAEAHERYRLEPAHSLTPDAIFETRWAHALLERTLAQLRTDFAARGKQRLFEALQSFLTGDPKEQSYQAAAAALGLPLSAIKTSVHRMRSDYRARLREEIGRTVSTPDEIEDELRHLRKVLVAPA